MESIGDAWGFSGKTPIALSGGFSVETLIGATPSWKTELNRSISAMEDGISGGLQHRHKTCCEKGGHRRRRACMVQRWHHHGDVVFRTGGLVYDKILSNKIKSLVMLCSYPNHMSSRCPQSQIWPLYGLIFGMFRVEAKLRDLLTIALM